MWWLLNELRAQMGVLREQCVVAVKTLSALEKLAKDVHHIQQRLSSIEQSQDSIRSSQHLVVTLLQQIVSPPTLNSFDVQFENGGNIMAAVSKKVGESVTARVVNAKDQFGNPFTIDFNQTQVQWQLSDGTLATQQPALDGTDVITLTAEGTEQVSAIIMNSEGSPVSVSAPGFITITAPPPPPTPVLSSFDVELD